MTRERRTVLLKELSNQLELYRKAIKRVEQWYAKCTYLENKQEYSEEETELLEILTARFARTSDLLTQKIIGIIDALELEEPGSTLDRINRAEKRNIIRSAKDIIRVRELRNTIVHEYSPVNLDEIFKEVLSFTPSLIHTLPKLEEYTKRFF